MNVFLKEKPVLLWGHTETCHCKVKTGQLDKNQTGQKIWTLRTGPFLNSRQLPKTNTLLGKI